MILVHSALRTFACVLLLLGGVSCASAQEPTPGEVQETRRQRPPQPSRRAASLDLGFTSSSGNSAMTALSTGIRIRHRQTRLFNLDWSANFRYGESQGEVVARHAQGDVGDHNVDVRSKLSSTITRRLAFTISHVLSYDSTPVRDVGRTDQRFQAGIIIDF